MCTFYSTLWLLRTDEEEGQKEEELWFALSLLCLLHHFQPRGWLEQASNRRRKAEIVSCSFMFLRMATASLCVEVGSVSPLTQYRWNTRTLCTLGVHWAPIACGSSAILCSWGTEEWYARGTGGTHCACLLCSHTCSFVPPDFTYKTKFKDKIAKTFKMATAGPNQGWGPIRVL